MLTRAHQNAALKHFIERAFFQFFFFLFMTAATTEPSVFISEIYVSRLFFVVVVVFCFLLVKNKEWRQRNGWLAPAHTHPFFLALKNKKIVCQKCST